MTLNGINKITGLLLITLSILVSIPLSIKTYKEGGGPWGFEIIGLAVLIPLSGYILFGIAGLFADETHQRRMFMAGHITTVITGVLGQLIFPVYPIWVAVIPITLALAGIASRNNFRYFLLAMMLLAIVANFVLLKWEIDFGRTIPFFQLFQAKTEVIP